MSRKATFALSFGISSAVAAAGVLIALSQRRIPDAAPEPVAVVAQPAPEPIPEAAPAPAQEVTISADSLWGEYGKNMVAADLKYQDKRIVLTGVPARVQKERTGRYFLAALPQARLVESSRPAASYTSVGSSRQAMQEAILNAEYRPGIVLRVGGHSLSGFADLQGVKTVTVRGTCKGAQVDKRADPPHFILIDECEMVSKE